MKQALSALGIWTLRAFVAALMFGVSMAATPQPVPVATATAYVHGATPPEVNASDVHKTLRLIGKVHAATSFCTVSLRQSDGAISDLLRNDRRIEAAQAVLAGSDFDKSELSKANGGKALHQQYSALKDASRHGADVVSELRAQAVVAPSAAQKAALTSFADALDDGLNRQGKIADELARMNVILDNRPRIDAQTHDRLLQDQFEGQHLLGNAQQTNSFYEKSHGDDDADRMVTNAMQRDERGSAGFHDPQGAEHGVMSSVSDVARSDAEIVNLEERAVLDTEQTAADRMDDAFAGC